MVDRRVGLPISLSLVSMEVARRLGLHLAGVGLPGHFIIRYDGPTPDAEPLLLDPYVGGQRLTVAEVGWRFGHPLPAGALDLEFLAPVAVRYVLPSAASRAPYCQV